MTTARTFGLIPAAGKSVRMGRPKLTLPLGGRTIVEWVIAALREGGVAEVLVVAGPHDPELPARARAAGASVLVLAEETPEMRATLEQGVDWLEQRFQPELGDGILLTPGDHPGLESAVVAGLLAERGKHSIIIPTYASKRGHPTWLAWRHVPALRALPRGQGLNSLLRQLRHETLELAIASSAGVSDLDTPEDYERLLHEWNRGAT